MSFTLREITFVVLSLLMAMSLMYLSIYKAKDLEREQIDRLVAEHTITVF